MKRNPRLLTHLEQRLVQLVIVVLTVAPFTATVDAAAATTLPLRALMRSTSVDIMRVRR